MHRSVSATLLLSGLATPLVSQTVVTSPAGSLREARIAAVIPYSPSTGQPSLTMDYYKASGPAPHPAVIVIHGGGFIGGTSRNGSEAYAADFLAPAGYAVFSINYRLYPAAALSAMVADTQRAVRFVRHNAARYSVDPNRIALLGGSAGGYLSNMAGVLPPSTVTQPRDAVDRESDAVQAVVTLYGLSDLATMQPEARPYLVRMAGAPEGASESLAGRALRDASPIAHVRPGTPPFLLIHGDRDEAVPIAQSLTLKAALEKAGNSVELITIPNGPHATGSWSRLPGVPDWERQMTEWLNRQLGHTGEVGAGIAPRQPTGL